MSTAGSQPPDDVPGLPRYAAWVRRVVPVPPSIGSKIARAPWKDAEDLAGQSNWVNFAAERRQSDADHRMHMVRGLVDEVLAAAGGIEREIRALNVAQGLANADTNTAWIPDPVPRPVMGPVGVGPPGAALDAAYATMNALNWIRSVQERVLREDDEAADPWLRLLQWFGRTELGKRCGVSRPKGKVEAGLLASLKDGEPKTTIDAAFKKLRPKLKDARKFDNYVLHGGGLPGGGTPVFHVRPDRTVYFPFPDDPNTRRFFTWEQFTYKQERGALTYIADQFDAIATFIDRMLDAFDALP